MLRRLLTGGYNHSWTGIPIIPTRDKASPESWVVKDSPAESLLAAVRECLGALRKTTRMLLKALELLWNQSHVTLNGGRNRQYLPHVKVKQRLLDEREDDGLGP